MEPLSAKDSGSSPVVHALRAGQVTNIENTTHFLFTVYQVVQYFHQYANQCILNAMPQKLHLNRFIDNESMVEISTEMEKVEVAFV